jgi:hypothetical protein
LMLVLDVEVVIGGWKRGMKKKVTSTENKQSHVESLRQRRYFLSPLEPD